jgi:methylated-DNA-[protein]-cysteine S-methyltransferase
MDTESPTFYYKGPFCHLLIEANKDGITRVRFKKGKTAGRCTFFSGLKKELDLYFKGGLKKFTIPLVYSRNSFTGRVLNALRSVPYGSTISYRDLACITGKSKASRAVGNAMAANPLPILIPCHRVIKTDGNLGEFGGGSQLKKKLLNLEGAI